MIKLETITVNYIDKIQAWIQADPFHRDDPRNQADALLTGKGLLTFRVTDDIGDVMFVRLDAEGDMTRLAIQFGPEEEVSKKRVVKALLEATIPAVLKFSRDKGYRGVVFESVNPSLIAFGDKQGFKPLSKDDYAFVFEGTCVT
jgi:hypothetical protein